MATDKTWYTRMAAAMNDLKKAENGMDRWGQKVAAAQAAIDALTAERDTPDQMPDTEALANEAAPIAVAPLAPVFGGTHTTGF